MMQLAFGSIPSSVSSSSAASLSFAFNLSRASSGNQSCMKLSSAQSTFADDHSQYQVIERMRKPTSISPNHSRLPTHRTIILSSLLHFHKTSHAEQMCASESNRFEGNVHANMATIIGEGGYNGYELLSQSLDEKSG